MLGLKAITSMLLESHDKIVTMAMFIWKCNISLKLIYNFQSRNARIARYLVVSCISKLKYTPVL